MGRARLPRPTMPNPAAQALLPSLLALTAAGCAVPQYEAGAEQEFRVPAAGLVSLAVDTHDGGITVTGVRGASEVLIKAELRVRGFTAAEAQSNLSALEVLRQQQAGALQVSGRASEQLDSNMSPSFSFTITAPAELVASLRSHNGEITVRGLAAALTVETHNGGVSVATSGPRVDLLTHNGGIALQLLGDGPADGRIETHNGSITLTVGAERSAAVLASTHNGALQAQRHCDRIEQSDNTLSAVIGGGKGRLDVTTHNGGVVLR